MGRARGEQRQSRRSVVPALRGLLADLRVDANPEPHAWLALHAGRLRRRHRPAARPGFLERGAAERPRDGRARRRNGAPPPAPPPGPGAAAGAVDPRPLLHRRRPLSDGMDGRSDLREHARDAQGFVPVLGFVFPVYRLAIVLIAAAIAAALWLMLDRTRLGAMIRAGVDDPAIARVMGIPVSRLFTAVFCLGAGL